MLTPAYTKQFEKDLKRMLAGGKDENLIKGIIRKLAKQESLENKHKDHKLKGNFKDRRECLITADWLLIHKVDGQRIIFERTGSHSDLFK